MSVRETVLSARATIVAMLSLALALWATAAQAKQKLLKSLPLGKDGSKLEIVCDSCQKGKDCLSVKATGNNAPAARLVLEDDWTCRGNQDDSTEYSAQELRLSPALTGTLIKMEAGSEAIVHSYWLVAVSGGKLRKLWSATYSTQEVVGIDSYRLKTPDSDGNGRQEIDYAAPFPISNNLAFAEDAVKTGQAGADTWAHQRLEFDDASKTMVDKAPHEEWAAVLVSTKTVTEALSLKVSLLKNPKCGARDFLVLDTEDLPKLRKGFYVVASISDSRAEAQASLNRIKACRPDIAGAMRQVR